MPAKAETGEKSGSGGPELPLSRRLLKLIHPEGIPWPGSAFYDLISSTSIFQRHYELVARHALGFGAEGRLLDIGTGPGWLLLKIHWESPAMRLVGMDVSRSMVARARKNAADAGLADVIETREGNVSRMPFADDSFDVVVSTGSIHHWKEPCAGLNDVYRVLKPGCYALMYDLVSDTPAPVLRQMRREFGALRTILLWLHGFEEPFYTRARYEALARPTLFGKGRSEFVGALCCLIVRKEANR